MNRLNDYQRLATSKGWSFLGPMPTNTHTLTSWKCANGHIIQKRFNDVIKKNANPGCPNCSGKKKKTAADYQAECPTGWTYLGEDPPPSVAKKSRWRCPKGHDVEVRFTSINQGQGCGTCTGNITKTIDDYHALAISIGWKFKAEIAPRSALTSAPWECPSGHLSNKRYNDLQQGGGCMYCSRSVSKIEKMCLEETKKIFPDALGDVKHLLPERPRMRIDIFIPSIQVAIEIDGHKWHSTQKAQIRDAAKDVACLKNNIQIFRIPVRLPNRGRFKPTETLHVLHMILTLLKQTQRRAAA